MVNVFDNRIFIIVISIIWGFGLALLFKKSCLNNQCVIIKAPPLFNNLIYENGKCYKLTKYSSQCIY